MGRRIEVQVDPRGRVVTDFSGFVGDDCFEEADRLAKVLASLGLAVGPGTVTPKPAAQQAEEAGLPAQRPGVQAPRDGA